MKHCATLRERLANWLEDVVISLRTHRRVRALYGDRGPFIFVSCDGDDAANGLSPHCPVRTTLRAHEILAAKGRGTIMLVTR